MDNFGADLAGTSELGQDEE